MSSLPNYDLRPQTAPPNFDDFELRLLSRQQFAPYFLHLEASDRLSTATGFLSAFDMDTDERTILQIVRLTEYQEGAPLYSAEFGIGPRLRRARIVGAASLAFESILGPETARRETNDVIESWLEERRQLSIQDEIIGNLHHEDMVMHHIGAMAHLTPSGKIGKRLVIEEAVPVQSAPVTYLPQKVFEVPRLPARRYLTPRIDVSLPQA